MHSCLAEWCGAIVRDFLIYTNDTHPVSAAYQSGHMPLSMTRRTLTYAVHSFVHQTLIEAMP